MVGAQPHGDPTAQPLARLGDVLDPGSRSAEKILHVGDHPLPAVDQPRREGHRLDVGQAQRVLKLVALLFEGDQLGAECLR